MSYLVRVYGFNGESLWELKQGECIGESLWALPLKFFPFGECNDIVSLTE